MDWYEGKVRGVSCLLASPAYISARAQSDQITLIEFHFLMLDFRFWIFFLHCLFYCSFLVGESYGASRHKWFLNATMRAIRGHWRVSHTCNGKRLFQTRAPSHLKGPRAGGPNVSRSDTNCA